MIAQFITDAAPAADHSLTCIIHEHPAAEADDPKEGGGRAKQEARAEMPTSTVLHKKIPAQRTDSTPSQEIPRVPCSYSHVHPLARAFMNNAG